GAGAAGGSLTGASVATAPPVRISCRASASGSSRTCPACACGRFGSSVTRTRMCSTPLDYPSAFDAYSIVICSSYQPAPCVNVDAVVCATACKQSEHCGGTIKKPARSPVTAPPLGVTVASIAFVEPTAHGNQPESVTVVPRAAMTEPL